MSPSLSQRQIKNIIKQVVPLVYRAGEYMMKKLGRAKAREKGEKDLVTEVDLWIESMYKEELSALWPDFGFLAEEENYKQAPRGLYWAIDPLDGTNNYAHTYPVFCTSVALMDGKRTVLGIVYDPTRDELFYSDGEKSFLNKRSIRVSNTRQLSKSLVCTGFAYRFRHLSDDNNVQHFVDFLYACQGVRRDGSAALDLCYVACGRFDGFWELNLKPWDTAAGSLVVKCAGGRITKFSGRAFDPFWPEVVASNGKIHQKMLEILNRRDWEDENSNLGCACR